MRLHATWPVLVNEPFRESAAGRAAFEAWDRVTQRSKDHRSPTWPGV